MSTLNDDLQAAQAENSPSVAAAVAAALEKGPPKEPDAPAVEAEPITTTDVGPG